MNAFDELGIEQQKARTEADGYRFFIQLGLVTEVKECIELYKWYNDDWSIRDKEGKTRLKLLQYIPDAKLFELINIESIGFQPDKLKTELLRRMPWYKFQATDLNITQE